MRKDYYQILGITDEEKKLKGDEFLKILKAKQRKLILQYHPDKMSNKSDDEKKIAEEKTKDINEAYSVLSNETERDKYDNFGNAQNIGGFDFSNFGGFNPFSDFFSGMGMNGFGNKQNARTRKEKGSNLRVSLGCTLEEFYYGTEKTIKYQRMGKCPHCNGSGKDKNSIEETCDVCGGTGMEFSTQETPMGTRQTMSTCHKCHGKGKIIKNPCKHCNGTGLVEETKQITISIPNGLPNGGILEYKNYGNASQNGDNGDLYVIINEKPHDKYRRIDDDLYFELKVPIVDAILGTKVVVPTIDGKKLNTTIGIGTTNGTKIKFNKQGMPNQHSRGDMYGIVSLVMPKELNQEEKDLLNNLKTKEHFK